VLRETDLHVPRGGDLLVTGDNGVGKSTFLFPVRRASYRRHSGRVLLTDELPTLLAHDLVRNGVRRGVLFDSGGLLFEPESAEQRDAARCVNSRRHLRLDEREIERAPRAALTELRDGATDFHALPAHLSLRRAQTREGLARALVLDPNFVFFDTPMPASTPHAASLVYEPFAALSRRSQDHDGGRQQ